MRRLLFITLILFGCATNAEVTPPSGEEVLSALLKSGDIRLKERN